MKNDLIDLSKVLSEQYGYGKRVRDDLLHYRVALELTAQKVKSGKYSHPLSDSDILVDYLNHNISTLGILVDEVNTVIENVHYNLVDKIKAENIEDFQAEERIRKQQKLDTKESFPKKEKGDSIAVKIEFESDKDLKAFLNALSSRN